VLKTGVIIAERYRLDDPIAAGGVGQVWRGTDLLLERPVAVKLLRPEYASHPETLSRFRAEARHAGALTHPGIAQVYDYGDGNRDMPPYLVMELVDGPSLADVLATEPVSPVYALEVIAKAAAGLGAAHAAGLVHRDIKPGNILLGVGGEVKITDFGIAYALGSAPVTDPGLVMGTTQYLAPERIAGGSGAPVSDLYSLGIMMHECLTGMPPFEGTPAEVMAAHLYVPLPPLPEGTPPEVEDLIARLTAKDPAERLSDAGELAALAQWVRAAITSDGMMPRQRRDSAASPVRGLPARNVLALPAAPDPAPALPAIMAPRHPEPVSLEAVRRTSFDTPPVSPLALNAGSVNTGPMNTGLMNTGPVSTGMVVLAETQVDTPSVAHLSGLREASGALASERSHGRRRAAMGIGLVVLAGAGFTGWIVNGGTLSSSAANSKTVRSNLSIVQPSTGAPPWGSASSSWRAPASPAGS
jgi:serine/threonine-protein kinase